LKAAGDHDAMFAAALQQSGKVVLGHLFLDRDRAQSSDANGPRNTSHYLAKAFPQELKVSRGTRFRSWSRLAGEWGNAYPGAEANLALLAEAAAPTASSTPARS